MSSDSIDFTKYKIALQSEDGQSVEADSGIVLVSGTIRDMISAQVADDGATISVPVPYPIEDLKHICDFIAVLREKFPRELQEYQDKKEDWLEFVPQHMDELRPVAAAMDKDALITGANAADFLILPAFISFCTFILSEMAQNLNLAQLRELLNEVDDFDEEQRAIIAETPEFAQL